MESNKKTTTNQEEKTTKKPFKLNYDKKAQINNEVSRVEPNFAQCFRFRFVHFVLFKI